MTAFPRLQSLLFASTLIAFLAPGPTHADEFSIDVNQLERVDAVYKLKKKKRYDSRKYIPKMDPSKDTFQVGLKVMTHTIQNYIEDQKDEELGQDNRKLSDAFESNINFLSNNQYKQNVSFRVKAVENTASVHYRGFTDATVNYIIGKDAIRMDVLEYIIPRMALMYSYLSAHDEARHTVSMNFTW